MIPCAYLRVFRALDTHADAEREHWERYILAGGKPNSERPVYRQARADRDARVGLLTSAEGDHAEIRLVDGRYWICSWRTHLRVLASIVSLRDTLPSEMVEALLPDGEVRRAARELARLKRREPGTVPSMLQSPWHVPLRWFALVDEPERRLEEGPDGYRLSYWTPMAVARRRATTALQALRRSELAPMAQIVRELAQWLSAFAQHCTVELDYASVSSLFTWDELDDDHSGAEIQEAVRALQEPGEIAQALERYQRVAWRWAEARNRESLN